MPRLRHVQIDAQAGNLSHEAIRFLDELFTHGYNKLGILAIHWRL